MLRLLRILPLVGLAACDPGATEFLDPDGGAPADAARGSSSDLARPPGPADLAHGAANDLAAPQDLAAGHDLAAACIPPGAPPTSGHHNPGEGCLGCHQGGNAPRWTLAGTLYTKASGGATLSGATIEAVDAQGQVIRIVTSTNGNFYTGQAITFPVTVRASACPSSVAMVDPPNDGNCNSCHDAAMRIHLP